MNQATAVNPAQAATPQGFSIWAVVSFLFMCALAYHYIVWGYNYRYSPVEDNWFTASIMSIVLIPLAFLERPATIMLVNAIRLKDNFLVLVFWFAIVCGLGFMAFNITMSSHETMAEQRDNRVSSHTSNLETINRLEDTAKSMLEAAEQNAKDMSSERASGYLAAAKVQYNRAMTKASKMRSQQYQDAPVKQEHKGEFDWLTAAVQSALIGLAFSLGAIIVTIYEQMHIKTTQRIPAFSLAPKLGQEWQAFKENFTAGNFDVDPTRGFFNGMFFKVKKQVTAPVERVGSTRNTEAETQSNAPAVGSSTSRPAGKERIESGKPSGSTGKAPKTFREQSKGAEENAAKTGKVYIQCPNCEAVYNPKLSTITPTKENPNGKLMCQECAKPFRALHNVIDNDDAKNIIKNDTDSGILSYDGYTLAALKDEGFEYKWYPTPYYVLPKDDGTATCLIAHPKKQEWLYTAKMDSPDQTDLLENSDESQGPFQDFYWALNEHQELKYNEKEKGNGGPYFSNVSFHDLHLRGDTEIVDDVPLLVSDQTVMIAHPSKPAWIFNEHYRTKYPLEWMHDNPTKPNSIKFKKAIAQYKELASGTADSKPAVNNGDNVIHGRFTDNSRIIREDNQEVSSTDNSPGINGELSRNQGGDNSQDSQANNSRNSRQIDLSEITQTDDKQAMLNALSLKIDELSADPEYDGVFFSPTETRKQLHLNYVPVQAIFDQKLKEGKLSKTKRYKIRYKALK